MTETKRLTREELDQATELVLSYPDEKVQRFVFELLTTETDVKQHRAELKAMIRWERARRKREAKATA